MATLAAGGLGETAGRHEHHVAELDAERKENLLADLLDQVMRWGGKDLLHLRNEDDALGALGLVIHSKDGETAWTQAGAVQKDRLEIARVQLAAANVDALP